MITKFEAIHSLVGGSIHEERKGHYTFQDGQTPPSEESILEEMKRLISLEPLNLLRIERNRRIAETDFYALSDIEMPLSVKNYRQELRDLPSKIAANLMEPPTLNQDGQLIFSGWPDAPF